MPTLDPLPRWYDAPSAAAKRRRLEGKVRRGVTKRLRASAVPVQEFVLPAPTDWPCALAEADGLKAAWAKSLRERFTEFLAGTASLLCPEPTPSPMKA